MAAVTLFAALQALTTHDLHPHYHGVPDHIPRLTPAGWSPGRLGHQELADRERGNGWESPLQPWGTLAVMGWLVVASGKYGRDCQQHWQQQPQYLAAARKPQRHREAPQAERLPR
ncbi:hypothetical protein D8B26_005741 [Coccidioides posadasii str. Silveira]|uniref:Uncharacterized protein n=1 Tax=Coccidioides posadasii (strain RMSCC 757 / Silveira) TaxID=443226 RepID=E9DAR7_COCPS|nr:hypothetical protein CPSG_06919 [Coccidioides posadasii str. Silveira]QVM11091.1 hypothetical protein D8B26_005741 [Coccidioides posadasii str. Silveira]